MEIIHGVSIIEINAIARVDWYMLGGIRLKGSAASATTNENSPT
jgi:hypothetical protein